MKKWHIVGLTLVAISLFSARPASALFGVPDPVIDVGIPENHTWMQTLVENIAESKSLTQVVQMGVSNLTPTGFGWPTSSGGVMSIEPILENAVAQLNVYRNVTQQQSGIATATDAATQSAEAGMAQLPAEQADLANAQAASDSAPGDLAAQQAGQRITALQVGDSEKLRQFLYAQQIQRSTEEADAEAWMTMPSTISNNEEI